MMTMIFSCFDDLAQLAEPPLLPTFSQTNKDSLLVRHAKVMAGELQCWQWAHLAKVTVGKLPAPVEQATADKLPR